MSHFQVPVRFYMSAPVVTVSPDASLDAVDEKMRGHDISSVAVVAASEQLVGVISRTDLLRVGRREAGTSKDATSLSFPSKTVGDVMTPDPTTVTPDSHLSVAAKTMVTDHHHRLFVVDGQQLVGVLSTKDVMHAVSEKRDRVPISEIMRSSVFTVRVEEPLSLAVERLEKAHVSGLVVVDETWPVGVFRQIEALESRDMPRSTAVEEAMSPAMICLNQSTPLHRAAAHAMAMDVRRIIAIDNRDMTGIVTSMDFARAASK